MEKPIARVSSRGPWSGRLFRLAGRRRGETEPRRVPATRLVACRAAASGPERAVDSRTGAEDPTARMEAAGSWGCCRGSTRLPARPIAKAGGGGGSPGGVRGRADGGAPEPAGGGSPRRCSTGRSSRPSAAGGTAVPGRKRAPRTAASGSDRSGCGEMAGTGTAGGAPTTPSLTGSPDATGSAPSARTSPATAVDCPTGAWSIPTGCASTGPGPRASALGSPWTDGTAVVGGRTTLPGSTGPPPGPAASAGAPAPGRIGSRRPGTRAVGTSPGSGAASLPTPRWSPSPDLVRIRGVAPSPSARSVNSNMGRDGSGGRVYTTRSPLYRYSG